MQLVIRIPETIDDQSGVSRELPRTEIPKSIFSDRSLYYRVARAWRRWWINFRAFVIEDKTLNFFIEKQLKRLKSKIMEPNSSCEKLDRRSSTSNGHNVAHDAEDIQIPVPWGYIAGKWWGPKDVQPIIVLHGRQDNAGSFDALIPLLSNEMSFLCLDLPGHGFSSHLPKGSFYYVHWDGVQLIRRIVNYFKWKEIKILGHSLGGAIGFLYAATYPDEVDALISIDIASPSVRDVTKTVTATADQIDRFLKYENLSLDNVPCYEYDEMIAIVEDGYNGSITKKSAEILMRRGMQPAPTPGRHYFSRDPRLKTSMLGMLSMDLVLSYASQIKCSYLNIRAVPGLKFDNPENYTKVLDKIKESSRRFEYREVPGSHHVHLNDPEKVAPIIEEFLNA